MKLLITLLIYYLNIVKYNRLKSNLNDYLNIVNLNIEKFVKSLINKINLCPPIGIGIPPIYFKYISKIQTTYK